MTSWTVDVKFIDDRNHVPVDEPSTYAAADVAKSGWICDIAASSRSDVAADMSSSHGVEACRALSMLKMCQASSPYQSLYVEREPSHIQTIGE